MRKLLVLGFLLCKCFTLLVINVGMARSDVQGHDYIPDDIIAIATRPNNYDYDDIDGSKRHYMVDERRNWRKKALSKPLDDHRDWDRRTYEYDNPRFMEDADSKNYNAIERQRDMDVSSGFKHPRYDDGTDKLSIPPAVKSSEIAHPSSFAEKDIEKKVPLELNCQRPHEKYESCFAGCASVTCDNPRDRMQPCYPFCEAGCVCVHPYVRDDRTHKCVLPEDCTKGLKGIPDLGEDATSR